MLTKKLGRNAVGLRGRARVTYSVELVPVFRHVKYVYDWLKPSLASVSITAGRVNASARNTTSGWSACTVAISHSQNANGLVCGLSTRNMRTPWSTQCSTTPSSASHSCFASGPSKSKLTMSW